MEKEIIIKTQEEMITAFKSALNNEGLNSDVD